MDRDPLSVHEAKALIRNIVENGVVVPCSHFKKEAAKDKLTIGDAENVLRGGVVRDPEAENGSWRYAVETPRIRVIVVLDSETKLTIITIMRLRD